MTQLRSRQAKIACTVAVVPKITIIDWKPDFPGLTGWDQHAISELKRRLKAGLDTPPAKVRQIGSAIRKRQRVALTGVRAESVSSITQILQTLGAEFTIDLEDANPRALFQKLAKR